MNQASTVFAAILHANGETQRRDFLLQAVEDRIATMHRTRGTGYGILDVYIHAIRGGRDRAIAGLRDAVDVGWGEGSWSLRLDPKLASHQKEPIYQLTHKPSSMRWPESLTNDHEKR